jgi:membrane-associated protease RseP (regulator of RpoE activity)
MGEREVVITGGSPWGMRLSGGKDFGSPLSVSKVTPGSKSSFAGVKDGDFILSINGQNTEDMKHMDAQAAIKRTGETLKLTVTQSRPKWAGIEITGNVSATSSLVPTQTSVATYYKDPPPATPTSPAQYSSPSSTYKPTTPPEKLNVHTTDTVDTGLEHGSSSQSPAYMRIMMGNEVPYGHTSTALGVQKRPPTQPTPPPAPPTPPTQQFKNIKIDDGQTIKTSGEEYSHLAY